MKESLLIGGVLEKKDTLGAHGPGIATMTPPIKRPPAVPHGIDRACNIPWPVARFGAPRVAKRT